MTNINITIGESSLHGAVTRIIDRYSDCSFAIVIFNALKPCNQTIVFLFKTSHLTRAAPILVSVSKSGQYQNVLAVSESVKYVTQVPILLLVLL